jgi:hypothetical protein
MPPPKGAVLSSIVQLSTVSGPKLPALSSMPPPMPVAELLMMKQLVIVGAPP